MVLSEVEVLGWFQVLEPARRLDFVVQLLQMLGPFELRFVGVCLEDLARKNASDSEFRGWEKSANDAEYVASVCSDISDGTVRQLLHLILPLVHSTNTAAATVIFQILHQFAYLLTPDNVMSLSQEVGGEVLVLLTMGRSHPAFRFDQRKLLSDLCDSFKQLQQHRTADIETSNTSPVCDRNSISARTGDSTSVSSLNAETGTPDACAAENFDSQKENANELVPFHGLSHECSEEDISKLDGWNQEIAAVPFEDEDDDVDGFCTRCQMRHGHGEEMSRPSSSATSVSDISPPVYITGIEVKRCDQSQLPRVGWRQIHLTATWSSGQTTEVVKTPGELYDYHRRLLDLFPKAAGCYGHKRSIPYFPGCQHLEKDGKHVNFPLVIKYVEDLKFLSSRILGCSYSCEFFGLPPPVPNSSSSDDLCVSRLFEANPSENDDLVEAVPTENVGENEAEEEEEEEAKSSEPKENPPHQSDAAEDESIPPLTSDPPPSKSFNCQQSVEADEDRDLCVKNGTVHECTFHNSSHPTNSDVNSVPGTAGTEDLMMGSSLSLPATLEGKEMSTATSEFENRGTDGCENSRSTYSLNRRHGYKHQRYEYFPICFYPSGKYHNRDYLMNNNKRTFHHGRFLFHENYVPEPLYGFLKKNNLLSLKPVLAKFTLEELFTRTASPDLLLEMGIPKDEIDMVIDCIRNAKEETSSRNGYTTKPYSTRDYGARYWGVGSKEEVLVTTGTEDRDCALSNGPKYVMSKSDRSTTIVSSSKGSVTVQSEYLDPKSGTELEENWDQVEDLANAQSLSPSLIRGEGEGGENSGKPHFSKEKNQRNNQNVRLFSRKSASVDKRTECSQVTDTENQPLPQVRNHENESPKSQTQKRGGGTAAHVTTFVNRKRRGSGARQKLSDPDSAKYSLIARRTNSDNGSGCSPNMKPGDKGWLQSDKEFPPINPAQADRDSSCSAAATSSEPRPKNTNDKPLDKECLPVSSPDLEKQDVGGQQHAFSRQQQEGTSGGGGGRARPNTLQRIPPPLSVQPDVVPSFGFPLVPSPPAPNPAFFANPPFLPQRYPYSPVFSPSFHPGPHPLILAHQSPMANGQVLLGNLDSYKIPMTLLGNNGSNPPHPSAGSQFLTASALPLPRFYDGSLGKSQAGAGGGGRVSCANCGRTGHQHQHCSEPTFDEITRRGNYSLNLDVDQVEEHEGNGGEVGVGAAQDSDKQG